MRSGAGGLGGSVRALGCLARADRTPDFLRTCVRRDGQVVGCLKVQPKLWRRVEIACETESRVGGDASSAVNDFRHSRCGDAQFQGELVDAYPRGIKKSSRIVSPGWGNRIIHICPHAYAWRFRLDAAIGGSLRTGVRAAPGWTGSQSVRRLPACPTGHLLFLVEMRSTGRSQ
jgi:hypothetical protein